MSYTTNPDKPEKLLANYTTVRSAELTEIVELIEWQGGVPVSAIERRFGRPSSENDTPNVDHVENCLKFLRAIDVIELSEQSVVGLLNKDIYPELPLEARLLHHVRQQEGEQSHLSYIFDVMAELDVHRVPRQRLYEAVQADDDMNFGFEWTKPKINMWANLADTLGAVSYVTATDENQIVTSPTRALLYDLLDWHAANGETPERLLAALDWIHDEFLPVYASRAGTPEVTAGVAKTLRNMEAEDVLDFRTMSDTQKVVELPRQNGDGVPVAEFTVGDRRQTAAYLHPLDRDEREVIA